MDLTPHIDLDSAGASGCVGGVINPENVGALEVDGVLRSVRAGTDPLKKGRVSVVELVGTGVYAVCAVRIS